MPRLLAAEIIIPKAHFLGNVPVADLCLQKSYVVFFAEADKSAVAHHRADDTSAQLPALLHVKRERCEHGVPVDGISRFVDAYAPVGVAVESRSAAKPVLPDVFRKIRNIRRPAARIYICAARFVKEHVAIGSERRKYFLRRHACRTAGAVKGYMKSRKRGGGGGDEMRNIFACSVNHFNGSHLA